MIPVLWLSGPPGVGKTAAAWETYQRLQRAGADPAYVDVDQLGMCFPPPAADPNRHTLKARNIAALRANFTASGARALVVSGVVDAERGPDVDALGGGQIRAARLRADPDELRARLRARGGSSAEHEAAVEEAQALDRGAFSDWCIDTSGLSVGEVVTRALTDLGDWPPAGREVSASPPYDTDAHTGGEMLWVSGATGVGKSTVGFRAYLEVLRSGERAAYVDIDQIGFCSTAPGGDHALRARNLAAVWRNFHAAGASLAIVTGRVLTLSESRLYEQALPGTRLTWRHLRVSDVELTRRILSRREGGSWAEPGDSLRDRPTDELLAVAHRAIATSHSLAQHGPPIDIEGLGVEDAAAALLARWPAGKGDGFG